MGQNGEEEAIGGSAGKGCDVLSGGF